MTTTMPEKARTAAILRGIGCSADEVVIGWIADEVANPTPHEGPCLTDDCDHGYLDAAARFARLPADEVQAFAFAAFLLAEEA